MKLEDLEPQRKDQFVGTSVRMEKSLDEELVRIAEAENVSKSILMRYALKKFVEEYNKL